MTDLPENSAAEKLRQLYRRICLLRGTERNAEAARLEAAELPAALAATHAAGTDDATIATLFRAEQARIADLRDLAEMLAPILAKTLNAAVGVASTSAASLASSVSRRTPVARVPLSASAVPSVADLIDGMLAQEHA